MYILSMVEQVSYLCRVYSPYTASVLLLYQWQIRGVLIIHVGELPVQGMDS
jgi:hypothetical protein